MLYHHRVYGRIKITEPVILDLIKTPEIQRLKNIEQGGYSPLYHNVRKLPSSRIIHIRFEHSLGAFILLRKFNVSTEEQIAGLIHDISHGIFSHSIDYVFGKGKTQDHGDKIFNKFFKQSKIPKILKSHGFQPLRFLNKKNFPILEKDLPDLCADRIDYILMLMVTFKEADKKTAHLFFKNLQIINNKWVFKNYFFAKKFAQIFRRINKVYLSDLKSVAMHHTIANLLKYAIDEKYITKKDIFTTDIQVISKIKRYLKKDQKLKELYIRFSGKMKYKNDPQDYDYLAFCKSRVVDPLCLYQGKIKRISDIDKKWKTIIKNELKSKKYFLKLY